MDAALIILDGVGVANHGHLDAVRAAETPNIDRFRDTGAFGTLRAWGPSVGLPDGGMGNSEVGHLTIGAGRIVKQAHTRINEAIESGRFESNTTLKDAFTAASKNNSRVHFAGLLSDAGVHSDDAHLHALIERAADYGVGAVTHVFTDGRDTPPTAALTYIESLEQVIANTEIGHVATVSGRYFAMDRDENWERTHKTYEAMSNRRAEYQVSSGWQAVEDAYHRGSTDEFIEPTVISDTPALQDGDVVILFNFRADRMRQITRMLANIRPDWPFETSRPRVEVVTMTEYDSTFDLPVLFPPRSPGVTLGSVLSDHRKTQLRIAETEKYAHVTYFLNGGQEIEFEGEHRRIIPSPAVATYDLKPEMSAIEVTETAIEAIDKMQPDILILNYANPDMVGHTGDYEAAVAAVETVDQEVGRLVAACLEERAHIIIAADHGNADDMGTKENPHTAHTFNPVPFIYLAPDGGDAGKHVRPDGELSDIAPTLLTLIGIEAPDAMTGKPLLI